MTINKADIQIEIIKEKRATIALSHRHGQFTVKAPLGIDDTTIANFIQANQGWIKKKQAELDQRLDYPVLGEEIDWNKHGNPSSHEARRRIHKALCVETLRELYVKTCQNLTNAAPPMRVTSLASAWGKCFSTSRIELNWRVARLPQELAEYVICHELAHLVHFDHSHKFWATVETLCSGARKKDRLLGKYNLDD